MTVATRITAFDQRSVIAGLAARTAQGRAAAARRVLRQAQEINRRALGAVPGHDTFVDGRPSTALETVRPDGTVIFQFELVNDVVAFCWKMLAEESPVKTGRYRASHRLYADGVEVASPEQTAGAGEIVILPVVSYARTIERGSEWTP